MQQMDDILGISAIFDIRVETLAATLLEQADGGLQDFGLEHLVVAPIGSEKRRYSKDVEGIRKKYYDHETALMIQVNRKGLFDTLPDGLFLRLDEEYKDAKTRTKAIAQQIKEARKFFLPFEQAMFHPRIEAEQIEQKYTESFPDFINEIWGLNEFTDCLNDRQQFLLCYLLPEAYRIVGNWKLTGLCFEAVLQKPIDLKFVAPKRLDIPSTESADGSLRLGENTILGESFQDDIPSLEVHVRGVTYNDIFDFLEDGKKRKVLEELLYSYFIPLDVPVETKIIVTEDTLGFTLGEAVLGYNVKFKSMSNKD